MSFTFRRSLRSSIALPLSLVVLHACAPQPDESATAGGEEQPPIEVRVDVHVDVHVDGDDPDGQDPAVDRDGEPSPSGDDPTGEGEPDVERIDSLFREVAFFQAVAVPVFADGYAVLPEDRIAPLIVGREAIVRAMFDVPQDWASGELALEVDVIAAETQTFRAARVVDAGSDFADPESGLVVSIPADAMTADAAFVVRLLAGGEEIERYPASADAELAATVTGPLKLHLVPFDVDGFLPDTSATVIDGLRDALMATYPVTDVVVTVGDVETWAGEADLGDINVRVGELQEEDMFAGDASWDTYYYAMVTGVATRDDYSGITGTSEGGGSEDLVRAYFAAGAAFGDQRSEDTLIHEIGHTHQLLHTACDGESDTDDDYPYSDGAIGVEGYDFRTDTFVSPDAKSMMAYCYPRWVSDYTFAKLARHVANAQGYAGYE
jgi:hypothetical protein